MTLEAGTRIGPYEIITPLGAGGMGEVYRARDIKLNREVAIKILPAAFASDADRVARFTREAHTLATLNHPHIAQIHGFDESTGAHALVMELVEGITLAERIAQGAVPIDEAIQIARQIADGLEAAHDKGIVHRDLKPTNIKLTPDGTVKILDFGLAKIAAPGVDVANSPTFTAAATQTGVIVGTAAYMSPEQARGRPVDQRSDIWAFGCVVYEMLTGRAPFSGETVTDVLSAVVRSEPDWRTLPQSVGPHVTRLLKRCLVKDPARRLRHAGDALLELEEGADIAGLAASTSRSSLLPYRVALALALVVIAILARRLTAPATEPGRPVVRFQIETAPQLGGVAVSPDGRALAYVAADDQGAAVVWVQSLEAGSVRKLDGTQGATGVVFWSPDSRSLAFGSTSGLKTIDVAGGAARLIVPNSPNPHGTWSSGGVIVFSHVDRGLLAVSATGGSVRDVLLVNPQSGERAFLMPSLLPDGRLLYTSVRSAGREICTTTVAGSAPSCLGLDGVVTGIVRGSYLLFARGSTLLAQRLDSRSFRVDGEAVVVAQNAALSGFTLSSSDTGVLAYRSSVNARLEELVWFDRRGTRLQPTGGEASFSGLDLSPDGRYAIVRGDDGALWLLDTLRGVFTKSVDIGSGPVWAPDGRRVAYSRAGALIVRNAFGGAEQTVFSWTAGPIYVEDWSRDGRWIALIAVEGVTRKGLIVPVDGGVPPAVFAEARAILDEFNFSPNGKSMVYNSDESGRQEIYVAPLPATGERWQISSAGGVQGRWTADGRGLTYLGLDATVVTVPILVADRIEAGVPQPLFKVQLGLQPDGGDVSPSFDQYRVAADGRFLFRVPIEGRQRPTISVIVNWPELTKR